MRRPTSTLHYLNSIQLSLGCKEIGVDARFFFDSSKSLQLPGLKCGLSCSGVMCLSRIGQKDILIKDIAVGVDTMYILPGRSGKEVG